MVEVIIALGSNLGDREENIRRALAALRGESKILDLSSVYETEPMYHEDQAPFLNCVVAVETTLGPLALLKRLKALEKKLGRGPRRLRYGPRTIDLDILFYGEEVVEASSLQVPHPRIAERAFVLVPLNEIRPRLVHPVSGHTIREMLDALQTRKRVVKRLASVAWLSSARPRRDGQPEPSPSRRARESNSRRLRRQ